MRTLWASLGWGALVATITQQGITPSSGGFPAAQAAPAPSTASPPQARVERQSERNHLVERGIVAEDIRDPRVIAAMRKVPRHRFVPEALQGEAYANRALPIGHGQTISQPFVVAFMTEAVRPTPRDRCLEIGTGSGYQAAVLAELCHSVHSIEYLPQVARSGADNLRATGYGPDRVRLRVGDGYAGWPESAPYDVIVVTASPLRVPQPLLDQLAVGGRLIIPLGTPALGQTLERWTRLRPGAARDAFRVDSLLDVHFVPFLGKGGS